MKYIFSEDGVGCQFVPETNEDMLRIINSSKDEEEQKRLCEEAKQYAFLNNIHGNTDMCWCNPTIQNIWDEHGLCFVIIHNQTLQ